MSALVPTEIGGVVSQPAVVVGEVVGTAVLVSPGVTVVVAVGSVLVGESTGTICKGDAWIVTMLQAASSRIIHNPVITILI